MELFGLNGWEPLVLLLVFLVIIGPQRLPEYTRNVIRWVRSARRWVDDSRATVENEMGLSMEELRKYDPRQYDPRRIIREAWGDTTMEDILPDSKALASVAAAGTAVGASRAASGSHSASGSASGSTRTKDQGPRRAPFDPEAT